MTAPLLGGWRRSAARGVPGRNRWLGGVLVATLVATSALDPTIGAADAPPLLDLGADAAPSTGSTVSTPTTGPTAAPRGATPLPTGRVSSSLGGADPAPLIPPSPDDGEPLAPEAPDGPGAPPERPCAAAAIVDAVVEAQQAVEAATSTPIPVDVATLFANLAGCGQGGTPNPLDALGVVSQLLDSLGIDNIPLPALPPLPLPPEPPPGLDALGSAVLPVCATVIEQLVTAAALAPLVRVATADVIALFGPVVQVCALFAPRA